MAHFDDSLDWLGTINASLCILRQSYPEGAGQHGYRFGPTLREEEIRAWEQILHIHLPEDYRQFLQHIGNGGCGPNGGLKCFTPSGEEELQTQRLSVEVECHRKLAYFWEYFQKTNPHPILSSHPEKEGLQDEWEADLRRRYEEEFPKSFFVQEDIFGSPYLLFRSSTKGVDLVGQTFIPLARNERMTLVMVLSGTEQGHVWAICGITAIPIEEVPRDRNLFWKDTFGHRQTFRDWYLNWLEAMVAEASAKRANKAWLATSPAIQYLDNAWLETVRQGVTELTKRGGYDPTHFGPSPTEDELATRERELGIRLPEDYRQFLLQIGNGGFGPGHGLRYFPVKEPEYEPSDDSLPFELRYEASINPRPTEFRIPFPFDSLVYAEATTGYLEIADFGCGSFEVLVVAGSEYGNVWCLGADYASPVNEPDRRTFKDWYLEWLTAMRNTARQGGGLKLTLSYTPSSPTRPTSFSKTCSPGSNLPMHRWQERNNRNNAEQKMEYPVFEEPNP
ncbi:SMI1/KNR4 family protein [Armatimonas sp.]|uniref:SMI1/KNR4 family protein n=1 Tax=Armatimonas sp. TaxID=1872638 RepID=UPI00374CF488